MVTHVTRAAGLLLIGALIACLVLGVAAGWQALDELGSGQQVCTLSVCGIGSVSVWPAPTPVPTVPGGQGIYEP